MAIFSERAAHSVNRMFSLYYVYLYFSCFQFWFQKQDYVGAVDSSSLNLLGTFRDLFVLPL